jgi:methylglutaconyl-CoA hydratase
VKIGERVRAVPQPTIAAISGACLGGALSLACCFDIRIASSDAFFSLPEVRLGFATGPDTALPVMRAMDLRAYRRYAMTGQRFGAEEALRAGLLHERCETGALDKALEAQIEEIMLAAPGAARTAKRIAEALEPHISADAFAGIAIGRDTDEAREGLAAFREKRKPAWYR